MESFWYSICSELNVLENVAKVWWQKIHGKYSEPNRFYHNEHEMMAEKFKYLDNANNYVKMATIFQYYEFDSKCDSVDKNCIAFREFVAESNAQDEKLLPYVLKLLGDVTIEDSEELSDDLEFLQDLDLSMLGTSPEQYQKYSELLQQEYAHLSPESYKLMRSKILQTFLTIPNIYMTQFFRDKLEETARNNIKTEILELRK